MIIKQTVVNEIERKLLKEETTGYIVEVEKEPQLLMESNIVENPLNVVDGVAYYFRYNWRDTVISEGNQNDNKLHDAVLELLEVADRPTRKKIADMVLKDKDLSDMENVSLFEFFSDYNEVAMYDFFSSAINLQLWSELLPQWTRYELYPVNVYTHSDSTFRLGNYFTDTDYILIDKRKTAITKKELDMILENYTDYFNGYIYTFKMFSSLQEAINNEEYFEHYVFGNQLTSFYNELKEINGGN